MAKTAKHQLSVTSEIQFGPFRFREGAGQLFSVRPGAPANDALQTSSDLLASALSLAIASAYAAEDDAPWALVRLIEMSKALLDASMQGGGHE